MEDVRLPPLSTAAIGDSRRCGSETRLQDVHRIGPWFSHVLRFARRDADFSQRQLARWSGVPKSTIADIETARVCVPLETAARLLRTTGFEIAVRRIDGDEVDEFLYDDRRDEAGRRVPAHLDVIAKPERQVDFERRWQRIIDPHRRSRPSRWTWFLNRDSRDIARLDGDFGVLGVWPRPPVQQDIDWVSTNGYPSWPEVAQWQYRLGILRLFDPPREKSQPADQVVSSDRGPPG